ncbi:MAG: FHA domain-containing protein, partial [Pseudomonadota bacterium]|nr:FHA domain-containing protein [Pseudomonadota bacterium]
MLTNILSKPIEVTIGEHTHKFNSLADFEFSLTGRTSVPVEKFKDAIKLSLGELKKEYKKIKAIEKTLVSILSTSMSQPGSINRALRELDIKIFSQDHSWREIISALHNGGDELNDFRHIGIAKYLQYLSSIQEILRELYTEKKKEILASTPSGTRNMSHKELKPKPKSVEMERLSKGENVAVHVNAGEQIDLLLSNHKCMIVGGETNVKFVDESGNFYDLKSGKNIIGRGSSSDIIMSQKLRDISRMHMVIEEADTNTLYLTDLSSHGTF